MNKIMYMGDTLGSEPSKYQQEKKSKEILRVAASESGSSPNRMHVNVRVLCMRGYKRY